MVETMRSDMRLTFSSTNPGAAALLRLKGLDTWKESATQGINMHIRAKVHIAGISNNARPAEQAPPKE